MHIIGRLFSGGLWDLFVLLIDVIVVDWLLILLAFVPSFLIRHPGTRWVLFHSIKTAFGTACGVYLLINCCYRLYDGRHVLRSGWRFKLLLASLIFTLQLRQLISSSRLRCFYQIWHRRRNQSGAHLLLLLLLFLRKLAVRLIGLLLWLCLLLENGCLFGFGFI